MTSVKFLLRPTSSLEEKASRLIARVIHRRVVRSVSTPILLFPHEWDAKKEEIIGKGENPQRSGYLEWAREELAADRRFFLSSINKQYDEGVLSAVELAEAYRRYKEGSVVGRYVEKLSKALYHGGQERTARAYRTAYTRLLGFTHKPTLKFEEMTPRLLKEFESQLRDDGRTLNTISFYMRNLRAIYNKASYEGIFEPRPLHPFRTVYTGLDTTKKRALSREEMALLNDLEFSDADRTISAIKYVPLRQALLLFLFSFHARGMSFVDMAYLRKDDIRNGTITYKRKKTGQMIEVRVTAPMRKIINAFSAQVGKLPYVFPIITNLNAPLRQQYESGLRLQNKRLGDLARMLGLKSKLSTHVARHSWASIAKNENLPLAVISEGLGHTSEDTTRIYLASFDRSILDRASEKVIRAIGRQ
ncbi:integrase [Parabacteroides sp. PF5-5]|uniref:tyrosine-type recombinase/integrase n=1 Tax=unclassified Parabacteroides TaxID=2649774 RepID=UPI002474E628|nr:MULTISPECIES: site-specific integrase [unclassified Parabacteroides]MDH6305629.1 integrase [Parabacteroides sp. PH5-39]MDH6316333.1 integrase [Parabacteroides sp. PF5-13]MDH6319816.1 integrase [Parabacteroides sp. PH5-13]MDH6323593.1 integrase [Parabacteroides sp. PH5-8]MDH6327520.1 integrase [Parabacteroides sp. PH5-41]